MRALQILTGCLTLLLLQSPNLAFAQQVWPGDTDNDGIAHHRDILNIGLGYDDQGMARSQQGTVWQPYTLQPQWLV